MDYIGVDISKSKFTAAFPQGSGYRVGDFENTPSGVKKFIDQLPEESVCVMEATGNYCYLLLYLLDKAGRKAALVNPKQIKNYARLRLSVTKTDARDARLIADYGRRFAPGEYRFATSAILALRQKRTVIAQLRKQRTATRNLKGVLELLPYADKDCLRTLDATMRGLEKQIAAMEESVMGVADSEFKRLVKLLTSVKGIGVTVATALVVATGGFANFGNAKQFSRYIGMCPTIYQSGKSLDIAGGICRSGDADLRGKLYIAAMSAARYNSACRETYKRMHDNGKPGKVALVAVANKLLRQGFAVVRKNTEYVDGFVSPKPADGTRGGTAETPLDQGLATAAGGGSLRPQGAAARVTSTGRTANVC